MDDAPGFLHRLARDFGEALAAIGLIDGLCLGIVAIFAIRGFFKGFVRQLSFLLAIFGGIAIANLWSERVATWLPDPTDGFGEADRLFLAYVVIFVAVLLAAALLAHALENLLDQLQLRSLDRLMGFAMGGLCGTVLVAILLTLGLVFTPRVGPGEGLHQRLVDSGSLRLVAGGVAQLRLAFPEPFVTHAQEILEQRSSDPPEAVEEPSKPAEPSEGAAKGPRRV